jgi:hypothetical protein
MRLHHLPLGLLAATALFVAPAGAQQQVFSTVHTGPIPPATAPVAYPVSGEGYGSYGGYLYYPCSSGGYGNSYGAGNGSGVYGSGYSGGGYGSGRTGRGGQCRCPQKSSQCRRRARPPKGEPLRPRPPLPVPPRPRPRPLAMHT